MHTRRIQPIAGTTYSVSLPKAWVKENGLSQKSEVQMTKTADSNLLISAKSTQKSDPKSIELSIEEYGDEIESVIMACYYKGYESIRIISNRIGTLGAQAGKIRRMINYMSGTEISHERKDLIEIRNLLDKTKVNVRQSLYRMAFIIRSSFGMLHEKEQADRLEDNEIEIDRLNHLITKICSISMYDMKVLATSRINSIDSIPSFLIVAKKLEKIGDSIMNMVDEMGVSKSAFIEPDVLDGISSEIDRCLRYVTSKSKQIFSKIPENTKEKLFSKIAGITNEVIKINLHEILDYLVDIQEEILTISFQERILAKKEGGY